MTSSNCIAQQSIFNNIWQTIMEKNIYMYKIMASSPITPWQIDGEKVETVADFIFLGSKITVDNDDWTQEIKRCLFLGRKAMTNLAY